LIISFSELISTPSLYSILVLHPCTPSLYSILVLHPSTPALYSSLVLQPCTLDSSDYSLLPVGKGGAAAGPAPAEPDLALAALPGDPIPLMTPDLALKLNPIVIQAMKAKDLPDAPATRCNLDTKCQPLKLRLSWIPKVNTH
jgi:hypothetical protein